jgi:hypothetical protein
MGAFLNRLEQEDGTPADPPTLKLSRTGGPATPSRWAAGRFACLPFATTTPIKPPVLVVEDSGRKSD